LIGFLPQPQPRNQENRRAYTVREEVVRHSINGESIALHAPIWVIAIMHRRKQ